MPEILTESFCERCGTRYTFESAAPRAARLKGIRVMSRGLKNFVMSDDTSMDEAMAAARSETDREATSQQLDAFHKTFNFCMSCRQYTCGNCWNETEGQCLSCSPHLGHEIMPAPFPDLDATAGIQLSNGTNGANGANGHDDAMAALTAMAWPTSDLMREAEAEPEPEPEPEIAAVSDMEPLEQIDATARLAALGAFGADAAEPVEPAAIERVAIEPVAAEAAVVEPPVAAAEPPVAAADDVAAPTAGAIAAIDPADVDGRAAAAASQTSAMFRRFRPGQSLDDEIAAYEREQAAAEASPTTAMPPVVDAPEPVAAKATPDEPAPSRAELVVEAIAAAAIVAPVVHEAPPAQAPAPIPAEPVAPAPVAPAPIAAEAAPASPPAAPEPVAAAPIPAAPIPAEPVAPAPIAAEAAPASPPAAPEPVAAEAAPVPPVDIVPQPTWQVVAPEAPTADGLPAPDVPAPANAPTGEPQWPAQPEWPSQRPAAGLPFLGRPSAPTGGLESLWAESAREVTSAAPTPAAAARPTTGVAPCISCGLSLSATARFCRRCGTRQG